MYSINSSPVSPNFKLKKNAIIGYCLGSIAVMLLLGVIGIYKLDAKADRLKNTLDHTFKKENITAEEAITGLSSVWSLAGVELTKGFSWLLVTNFVMAHLLGVLGASFEHFGLTVLFGLVNVYSTCGDLYYAITYHPSVWLIFFFEVVITAITFSFAQDIRRRFVPPVVDRSPRLVLDMNNPLSDVFEPNAIP